MLPKEQRKYQTGTHADQKVVLNALDGDRDALRKIMNLDYTIILEQPRPDATVADQETEVTRVKIETR